MTFTSLLFDSDASSASSHGATATAAGAGVAVAAPPATASAATDQPVSDLPEDVNWADHMDLEDTVQRRCLQKCCVEWAWEVKPTMQVADLGAGCVAEESCGDTHNPYSLGVEGLGEDLPQSPFVAHAEAALVDIIVDQLENSDFNPGHGSVAIEKVQSALTRNPRHRGLMQTVLRHRTFVGFIAAQTHLFCIVSVHSHKKRMRYILHTEWEEADRQNRVERHSLGAHWEQALRQHLQAQPHQCSSLTDFMEAYPSLSCNAVSSSQPIPELPRPGDLLRMVRHWRQFHYDAEQKLIYLRSGTRW
eukprot:EG_transcript_9871